MVFYIIGIDSFYYLVCSLKFKVNFQLNFTLSFCFFPNFKIFNSIFLGFPPDEPKKVLVSPSFHTPRGNLHPFLITRPPRLLSHTLPMH